MFGKKTQEEPDFQYFTIFDTKTGSYKDPMPAINEADMIRILTNMYNDPRHEKNQLVTNPEDFQVFKIGGYIRKSGELVTQQPSHVMNLHEIRAAAIAARPDLGIVPT